MHVNDSEPAETTGRTTACGVANKITLSTSFAVLFVLAAGLACMFWVGCLIFKSVFG
ncbi:MAG: hypothetical protein IID41_18590 [Planctomycetes bacterium]|nr:hypothetical protein [Planctomycetota bacterium]